MRINGLGEIASQFDAMLIDQFGVIHDGEKLYPGALEILQHLHAAKIPVCVMTNSGRRASLNRQRISRMGIPPDLFADAISSGEVAYESVKGAKAYLIGKPGEDYGFDGVTFVADPAQADIMLILGSDAPRTTLAQYRELFTKISLPAVCCNPDKWMLTPDGLQPAPGAIAALYEEMGRAVQWVGKPHAAIYQHALNRLGNPSRVLCIGDSTEHDIAGGKNAGLATLLVMTGVSAGLDPTSLEPKPDYVMEAFTW